jgi:probable phosphoglycerate mutase
MPPMTSTRSTRFCLIRHGETDWNSEKRLQGQIDIDLNATGEAQARAVGPRLTGQSFAAAYSSDLRRAWRTAQIATAGLDLALSPAVTLRERHFGVLQGVTSQEASLRHPQAHGHHLARTPDYDYETGESLNAFAARVMSGLEEIAALHAGSNVLAFTHGGVLDVVYRAATARSMEAPRDFSLANAAFNWVEHRDNRWLVISWGDCRHLDRTLDEIME